MIVLRKTTCFLLISLNLGLLINVDLLRAGNSSDISEKSTTEWGWPLPYEQVSQKSLDWLESKGWLPLSIGYFADAPGFSASYAVIKEMKLLKQRGIPVEYFSFLTGPPIVESFLGGRTQVTHYGDFPFWLTVDKGAQVAAYALTAVNYRLALMVRPGSAMEKPENLKQKGRTTVVGTTLGSFAEFYLTAMTEDKGIKRDKDYRVAGLSMRDAQLLPKGTDAVVLWDPHISFSQEKGTGRVIDTGYPYLFITGFDFVRKEILENAPDVVQALSDAAVEALLYAKYDIDNAVDFYRKDPRISLYSRELIKEQISMYLTSYDPRYRYIHKDFWAREDSRIVNLLHSQGRLTKHLSIDEMKQLMYPRFMANTFKKLGWEIPSRPVFLPADWNGTAGKPPYPKYQVPEVRKE